MNLLQTNENFSSLSRQEKISLLKGMSSGEIPQAKAKELHFTVIAYTNGDYSLLPGGEIITMPTGDTIERYLERKYPLNRVGLQKIDAANFPNSRSTNNYIAA